MLNQRQVKISTQNLVAKKAPLAYSGVFIQFRLGYLTKPREGIRAVAVRILLLKVKFHQQIKYESTDINCSNINNHSWMWLTL